MKNKCVIGSLASVMMFPSLLSAKEPIVMQINGKDVKLSEFEYLYNKNKQQQLEPQTFDEYVDMFVTYKLKVADAESAGIDTLNSFVSEFKGYRDQLIQPFLEDKSVKESLVKETYDRTGEDIEIIHLMYNPDEFNKTTNK